MKAIDKRRRSFNGLQYLRGIAALLVVFHHARTEFGDALTVTLGAHRVEIFFVISGFVMISSTRETLNNSGLVLQRALVKHQISGCAEPFGLYLCTGSH